MPYQILNSITADTPVPGTRSGLLVVFFVAIGKKRLAPEAAHPKLSLRRTAFHALHVGPHPHHLRGADVAARGRWRESAPPWSGPGSSACRSPNVLLTNLSIWFPYSLTRKAMPPTFRMLPRLMAGADSREQAEAQHRHHQYCYEDVFAQSHVNLPRLLEVHDPDVADGPHAHALHSVELRDGERGHGDIDVDPGEVAEVEPELWPPPSPRPRAAWARSPAPRRCAPPAARRSESAPTSACRSATFPQVRRPRRAGRNWTGRDHLAGERAGEIVSPHFGQRLGGGVVRGWASVCETLAITASPTYTA